MRRVVLMALAGLLLAACNPTQEFVSPEPLATLAPVATASIVEAPSATGTPTTDATLASLPALTTPTARATDTGRPTATPTTLALTPTPTAMSTPLPGPANTREPARDGTPPPQPRASISPATVADVVELARWGTGVVWDVAYSSDGRYMQVETGAGAYYYEHGTLNRVPPMPWLEQSFAEAARRQSEVRAAALITVNAADNLFISDVPAIKTSVDISIDGKLLVGKMMDPYGAIGVWDLESGEHMYTLVPALGSQDERCWGGISDFTISSDGAFVVAGCGEIGGLWVWETGGGSLVTHIDVFAWVISGIAISPGNSLVAALANGGVQVWRLSDGALLYHLRGSRLRMGIEDGVLRFSPDGRFLTAGLVNGQVLVWRIEDGGLERELHTVVPSGDGLSFSADASLLAVGAFDAAQIWQTTSGWALSTYTPPRRSGLLKPAEMVPWRSGPSGLIYKVSLSADGRHLAALFDDWEFFNVRLWRVESARLDRVTITQAIARWAMVHFVPGQPDYFIATVPSGFEIIQASDLETASQIEMNIWEAIDVAVDASGAAFAVAPERGPTTIVGIPDGGVLGTISVGDRPYSLAVFDSASKVAVVTVDSTSVWSVGGQQALYTLATYDTEAGQRNEVSRIAVSADSQVLATGDRNGVIRLWRASDGELLRELIGHQALVRSMAFSADGRYLASGSADGTVRLWGVWP